MRLPAPRLHRALLLAALLPALAALAPAAHAEVKEELKYTYYEVEVRPGRLDPQIRAATPIRENGRPFHGNTRWYVRWRYQVGPSGGPQCRVATLNVELTLEITLPKIRGASARQQQAFDRYLEKLRAHEMGHVEIDREAARAVERELLALPPGRDCDSFRAALNTAGHAVLERYRRKNRDYDDSTNHGRSQGAVLND